MKKTKLKLVAVATALAMTFALAVTATGCSDGGDGTTTDGTTTEGTSGGSSSGSGSGSGSETDSGSGSGSETDSGSGSSGGSETGDEEEEKTVKTKYTNSAWVKTGVTAAYDGVYISWTDIGLDESLVFSDYDYLKVNVTYSKDGEEVTTAYSTGFCHLSDGTDNLLTISNINNGVSSDYNSAWFPIGLLEEAPAKIMIQNAADNVDTITVNYLEFVKMDSATTLCMPQLDGDNGVIAKGAAGKTVVFGVAYTDKATAYNGIGQQQLNASPWTASSVTFLSGGTVTAGSVEEIEKSYDDIKSAYDDNYTALSFYNGAALQYIYIK